MVFFAAVVLAGAFLAAVFLAGVAFFAAVFFAGAAFLAAVVVVPLPRFTAGPLAASFCLPATTALN
ncbi:hypothetical protein BJF87_19040 [Gordonia sp. CNJ-863]|nr:hypothetical protein BJF87_19040 [Gordonia sp. CNJ-863]